MGEYVTILENYKLRKSFVKTRTPGRYISGTKYHIWRYHRKILKLDPTLPNAQKYRIPEVIMSLAQPGETLKRCIWENSERRKASRLYYCWCLWDIFSDENTCIAQGEKKKYDLSSSNNSPCHTIQNTALYSSKRLRYDEMSSSDNRKIYRKQSAHLQKRYRDREQKNTMQRDSESSMKIIS